MSDSGHNKTNRKYNSCSVYHPKQYTCDDLVENNQLYDAAQLNNHYHTNDGNLVATELELLASRCWINETQIKSICHQHRSNNSWENDQKCCKIANCSTSTIGCVRAGKNASIEIQKSEHDTKFPILGYVCSQCQQYLSKKYGIHGRINKQGLWETQPPQVQDRIPNTIPENHAHQASLSKSRSHDVQLSGQSTPKHNDTTPNVQKSDATSDSEPYPYQEAKRSAMDTSNHDSGYNYSQFDGNKVTFDGPAKNTECNRFYATNKEHNNNMSSSRNVYNSNVEHGSRYTVRDHTLLPERPLVSFGPGRCGLNNLGNTCFMNSALQCLIHIPELKTLFRSSNWKKSLNQTNPLGSRGKVAEAFARLLESMHSPSSSHSSVVSPSDFKNSIAKFDRTFASYDQQDPFYLLNSVLDALHEDLKHDERDDSSPISKLFHGYTVSIVQCVRHDDHKHRPNPEVFSSLSLNIPNKPPFTLDQCFVDMCDIHYQTDNSEWYCSYCKDLSQSSTETRLHTLPPILIIHFKRFDYDPKSYVYIDDHIDFPLIFQPGQYMSQTKTIETEYELVGVCLRHGSLRGGHAYAYAKLDDREWYRFNDSSVTRIVANEVLKSNAYILVYRRGT